MPRFHFDLVDGKTIADPGGQECRNLDEAKQVAQTLAFKLATSRPEFVGRHFYILVTDEEGEEVFRESVGSTLAH